MKMMNPKEIEKRSFEIIEEKLGGKAFGGGKDDIIKRVIHTSADFDYAENLIFSENAVENAVKALKNNVVIVTDTNMAFAGINKKILKEIGGEIYCFTSDEDVAREAERRGVTRAIVSMEKAAKIKKDVIFAIGNAPTALIRLKELIDEGKIKPKLVIGVPVGFVNVIRAKEMIINSDCDYIVSKGNKGGSSIAAAICNALLYKVRAPR